MLARDINKKSVFPEEVGSNNRILDQCQKKITSIAATTEMKNLGN